MSSTPTIRRGVPADRDDAAALIDTAFFDLGANDWLVPEVNARSATLRPYFGLHVEHALQAGTIWIAEDDSMVGVALWYPSDDPGPDGYEGAVAEIVGPDQVGRFREFEHLLHEHTPAEPHEYLGFLAVHPRRQAAGIGSALLTYHHAALDLDERPAYLVASNTQSRRLYERHGYRPTDHHELVLPNGARMWRMWRPARSRRQDHPAS